MIWSALLTLAVAYNLRYSTPLTAKPIALISEPCRDYDGLRIKEVSGCAQPSKLHGPCSWHDLFHNLMEVKKKHVLRESHDMLGVLISGASSLHAKVNFCEPLWQF